ncbi:MAG: hypothetical protein A2Y40_00660 [Candidatus Margulisbacteria bacterium GWF2_35_9]|nr:MAG: hypothetical protein A2Y40_00660 [Candidatus Margulisbacteria bacterium GWF2_35_9]
MFRKIVATQEERLVLDNLDIDALLFDRITCGEQRVVYGQDEYTVTIKDFRPETYTIGEHPDTKHLGFDILLKKNRGEVRFRLWLTIRSETVVITDQIQKVDLFDEINKGIGAILWENMPKSLDKIALRYNKPVLHYVDRNPSVQRKRKMSPAQWMKTFLLLLIKYEYEKIYKDSDDHWRREVTPISLSN